MECFKCKRRGHAARACRNRLTWSDNRGKKPTTATHQIREDENGDSPEVNTTAGRAKPIMQTMGINGSDLQMEVDTGTSVSIICEFNTQDIVE